MASLKKYYAYTRLSILTGTAFRWQVIWGFITGIFIMVFNIFLWSSVYANKPEIGGMSLNEMLNYFLLVQIVSMITSTRIDREISREIMRGEILNRLIRPLNIYIQGFFTHLGSVVWNLLLSGLPILIVSLFIINVTLPRNISIFFVFSLSILLGLLISYNINFLAGITAAWVRGSEGITHAKDFLVVICAGSILPLSFYPSVLQDIFKYLPFKFIISVPLNIYLGKTNEADYYKLIVEGIVWILLLCFLNAFLYKKAFKKIMVYGG